ncbi:MAG TPA: 3'-5' exonuclease, partial [Ktedonobacterales bacterium]
MRSQPVRVAIDLETTGLHPEHDAIIEIGAVKFAGGQLVETFESFVACANPIPYRVRRLTGISAAQLRGAPPLA